MRRCLPYLVLILVGLSAAGCVAVPTNQSNNNLSSTGSSRNDSNSMLERKSSATEKQTRVANNQKEIVIEIAALKGKGYPSPADLDTGSGKTKVTVSK